MPIFVLVSYCFDACSFVLYLEVQNCNASSFGLLSQGYFGYPGCFLVLYKFYNCLFQFCEKFWRYVTGIALNVQTALGSIDILPMSMGYLPISLCRPQFLSSVFSEYRSFTCLDSLFLGVLLYLVQLQMELFS